MQASTGDQYAQMNSVAAIVQTWNWQRFTIIYVEGIDSTFATVISLLLESLGQVGAEISQLVPSPYFTPSLSEELMRLRNDQSRVFVVHTSLKLATRLFQKAEQMQMMGKDYAWIATNPISDLIHSVNLTTISIILSCIIPFAYTWFLTVTESKPHIIVLKESLVISEIYRYCVK